MTEHELYKQQLIFRSEKRVIKALIKIQEKFGGELKYSSYLGGKVKRKKYTPDLHFFILPFPQDVFLEIDGYIVHYYESKIDSTYMHHSRRTLHIAESINEKLQAEIRQFVDEMYDELNA